MKKKNSSKWLYKLFKTLVLIIPTGTFLILSATILNIDIHADVSLPKGYALEHEVLEDKIFFYDINAKAKYKEVTVYYNYEVGQWGFDAQENDIIKINRDYIAIARDDNFNLVIEDVKAFSVRRKETVSLPLSVFISIFGGVVIFLVISGKMKFLKGRPITATLVSLILGTLVLAGIDMIVSDLLRIFQIFTASWAIFYIIHLMENGILVEEKAKDLEEKIKDLI